MKKEIITKILIIISVSLLLILGPLVFYTFNKPFYYNQIEKNNFENTIGKQKATELTNNVLNFLEDKEKLSDEFTTSEKNHMQDVKNIFDMTKILLALSLITIISSIVYSNVKKKKYDYENIRNGSILALIFLITILIGIMLSFDSSFILFHKIFFPQGNWQFPINSLLITIFPIQFFQEISTRIFLTSTILSLVIGIISMLLIKRKKLLRNNHRA